METNDSEKIMYCGRGFMETFETVLEEAYRQFTQGEMMLSEYLDMLNIKFNPIPMHITELTAMTMVIEIDNGDSDRLIQALLDMDEHTKVKVFKHMYIFSTLTAICHLASSSVLLLYFNDPIPEGFHIGDKVGLKIGQEWFEENYENSRTG